MELHNLYFAFGLTFLAGLSTGIGSTIAFFARTTNTRFLSVSPGFSAGVMIYVSLVEIFEQAKVSLLQGLGATAGYWVTVASFFGGMILIAIIDRTFVNLRSDQRNGCHGNWFIAFCLEYYGTKRRSY
jgi:ZIP family zinc transporter